MSDKNRLDMLPIVISNHMFLVISVNTRPITIWIVPHKDVVKSLNYENANIPGLEACISNTWPP